jgi:purine-nucleoside phosphorylase
MRGLYEKVEEAAAFLRRKGAAPRALVILGTGLGGLGARFEGALHVPYEEVPHFPRSTAPGHAGHLVFGLYGGVPAMVMEGRFHYYEGYPLEEVTLGVRVAKSLGARTLLITNATGGLNLAFAEGDIVGIDDHLNLMGASPLRGENDERLGPRFPDLSAPYDRALLARAEEIARANGFALRKGVLVAVAGPQLETRAEYRWLRAMGADVVGMSTVPECITAVHAGMRVCALSVVTDRCDPDDLHPVKVEKILAVAAAAAPRLEKLLLGLLPHA